MEEYSVKNLQAGYFETSKIFRNEQMRRQYFEDDPELPPNLKTIPHRDSQMNDLDPVFTSIAKGRRAYAKIFGPNGTGKTLTINWLSQVVYKGLTDRGKGDNLHICYINCAQEKGSYRAIFRKIVNSFPAQIQKEIINKMKGVKYPLPESGLPAVTFFHIFRECYYRYNRQLLIILDEFDKMHNVRRSKDGKREISRDASSIIYNLVEVAKSTINHPALLPVIDIIVIINSMQRFQLMLDASALNRFQGIEVHFGTYSETELVNILETRKPAFHPGVLENNVIPEIAEYVALGEGNARVAIDLLGLAGILAEKSDTGKFTTKHVKKAIKMREKNLLIKPILELNFDHTIAYITVFVTYYTNQESNRELVSRPVLYNAYKFIFRQITRSDDKRLKNIKLKTPRQFNRYLDEQLESEHLVISSGNRPIYYGIPPEHSPGIIKQVLLTSSVVKDYEGY